jgi:hypothetical protein
MRVSAQKIGERHRFQFRKNKKNRCTVVFFVILDIDVVARSTSASIRNTLPRGVARTPNRKFCNKKIFRDWRPGVSSALARRRFTPKSNAADSGPHRAPMRHIAKHRERSVTKRELHRSPRATLMRRLKRRVWISGDR